MLRRFFGASQEVAEVFFNQRRFSKLEAIIFASVIRGAKREPLEDPGSQPLQAQDQNGAVNSVALMEVVSELRRELQPKDAGAP